MGLEHKKLIGLFFIFVASIMDSARCNFEEKNVLKVKENETFILTYGFESNPNVHEQNIFEFHATKDTDYLILNAYEIKDFTHNPSVFVTPSLQMLQQLFAHISLNQIPSNITYTNCTLSYSQSCIISDISSKVKVGDTFYLIFVGVGVNRRSYAELKQNNFLQSLDGIKQVVEANSNTQMALVNPSQQQKLILQLQENNIQQIKDGDALGQIEVTYLNASGSLIGDNQYHSGSEEWNNDGNKVNLIVNNNIVTSDKLTFVGKLQQNRQFVVQFKLQDISTIPLGENRNVVVEVENNYTNNKIIAIAFRYKVFSQNNNIVTLTAPVVTTLLKKLNHSKQYDVLIHYQHPLFEFLASQDKENERHSHLKPPKNFKFIILLEFINLVQKIQPKMLQKVYYSNESLESNEPEEVFVGQNSFKIDVNKITKVVEQINNYKGIYLLLSINSDEVELGSQNDIYQIKSNLLTERDTSSNSDGNNNTNNNNTNNNNNNNNGNTSKSSSSNKNDDTVLILIVVIGIGFIITSTLVYVKCIQNRNGLLQEPEHLEEVGEDGDKQNENADDIEKSHSSGDNISGNSIKKPQSTKNSTKTNGNHIQLAQFDDKSGLDELDHNHSSERKSNNHNGDLSANNLNNDKNELIQKKLSQRKKNKKSHLRIEIEESDNAKEQQQYLKQQQLKLLQQKALQQKQQQRQNNQQK